MKYATALVFAGFLAVVLGASVNSGVASPHIIGGNEEALHERAFTVRLDLRKNGDNAFVDTCGGVRISQRWFLTAAECLDQEKYSQVRLVHAPDQPGYKPQGEMLSFDRTLISIHPEYNSATKANNLGLIYCGFCYQILDEKNLPLLPKMSEKTETFSGLPAEVSGWTGSDKLNDFENAGITAYTMNIVNPFLCRLAYFFRYLGSEQICLSSWGGKRIAKTDAGVPLIVEENSNQNVRTKLVGIGSSVMPWTTMLPVPTVFTKIGPHVEWISQKTGISIRP